MSAPAPPAGTAALAVFARPVVPGRTKTRLARVVGDAAAAALYGAFLSDTLATARRARGLAPTLWVAGDPDHPSLARVAAGLPRARQPDGDLGARMQAALDAGLRRHPVSLVVGTDAPTLPAALLEAAAARLAEPADGAPRWVVGPAIDGGFWLLGVRAPLGPGALDGIPWSAPTTLEATRARLAPRLGPPATLSPWYDVDGAGDLPLLRAHVRSDPSLAPATRAWLAANSPAPPPPGAPRGPGAKKIQ